MQIARWTGADHYAADTFLKAEQGLENAEGYLKGKAGQKPIGTVAREAVQMAEDARIITMKKINEEQLMAERKAGAERESRAENGRDSSPNLRPSASLAKRPASRSSPELKSTV